MRLLLALSRREWYKRYSCIGCGRCMLVCPVKIMPYFIARLGELGDAEGAKRYGADRCIGCGACAAVCPSGVELTAIMKTVLTAKPPVLYDWGELD